MSDVVDNVSFGNSTDSNFTTDINDSPKTESTAGGRGTSVDKAANSGGSDDYCSDGSHADYQVTNEKIPSMFEEATSW